MRLCNAAAIYEVGTRATATRETVHSSAAARFATEVRRISRATSELVDDDLWNEFTRGCRRTLRKIGSSPLPFNSEPLGLRAVFRRLRDLVERARGNYPDAIVARAELCANTLAELSTDAANPLGSAAVEILQTGNLHSSGLLVGPMNVADVERWLAPLMPRVRVLTERELTGLNGLESLAVIGPSFWYPDHLLSAPRAELICLVHYDWLRDRERDTRLFASSPTSPGIQVRSASSTSAPTDEDTITADDLMLQVDWDALARASGGRGGSRDDPDLVDANLFLLADDYSVYLEAVDGPTVHVVDVEAEGSQRLRSERTRAVTVGSYIVLRSAGGSGDYIPEIADAYLGGRARRLRSLQKQWKEALRRRIREFGYAQVDRDLRVAGVASPNLRYRVWQHSLRAREPNDFRILMDYIGLDDQADELWIAMEELSEAHVRAGQRVRHLLEEAVLHADTADLVKYGRLDVRLDEIDAGALSVLRVEGRSPESMQVAEDDLRVVTKVNPDLWQG